jgi:type IV secretion system protein VirB6
MPSQIFSFLGETVSNAATELVIPTATNLVEAITPITISGLTIYFMLTGYQIMTGSMQEYFYTFLIRSARIVFITMIGLNVANYAKYVIGFFEGFESGIASILSLGEADTENIYETLDGSFNRGLDAVDLCFENASSAGLSSIGSAFGWIISAVVVAIGTLIVTAIGGAMVIFAKFAMAILFAIGPIFFVALMFPMTAKFFDLWLAQIINYILTIIMVAIIMSFAMLCYNTVIGAADFTGQSGKNPGSSSFQILLLTIILTYLIKRSSEIASGLSGGVALAALGVRHFISPVTSSAKGLNNAFNPISTRRDLQTGMMTSGSRLDHLMSGNTVMNPAYRQAIMQNLGRNWGRTRGGKASGN